MKLNKLAKELQFHGGKRLAEGDDRWFWVVPLMASFGLAVTVVCVTIRRFLENPTYMVKEETVQNKMDFPSVIICPEIFFRKDRIDKFMAHVEIPQSLNASYLKSVITQLGAFYSPDVVFKTEDLENIQHLLDYNNMDADTAGRLLTTSCENTLIRCRWQGAMIDCSNVFHMRLTADGYCCVFNGRSLSSELTNIHFNEIYRKWQTESFGVDGGLMLVVNQSQELFDVDLSYKWIALQSSRHYVESTINGTALNPGSEQWVAYHIRNFKITDDARSLSDDLRRCRLASEPLRFFPLYTKSYCIVECEMAYTLNKCKCVKLVHPRPKGAPYCGASRLMCAKQAMVSYDSDKCYCPQACDVATDFTQSSNFALLSSVRPIDPFYDDLDFSKVTIVRVFIHNRRIKTNARRSYFHKFDLFSELGGVFSVFFGCSILSLLELAVLALRALRQFITSVKKKNIESRVSDQPSRKDEINFEQIVKRNLNKKL